MHWLRLFVVVNTVFTNFHCDVGRKGVEIHPCIKFCFSQCFSFVNYVHIHIPLKMYWLGLFFVVLVFQEI